MLDYELVQSRSCQCEHDDLHILWIRIAGLTLICSSGGSLRLGRTSSAVGTRLVLRVCQAMNSELPTDFKSKRHPLGSIAHLSYRGPETREANSRLPIAWPSLEACRISVVHDARSCDGLIGDMDG